MTLEEVVDVYGETLGTKFIVHRQILEGETSFKALKKYVITLYKHTLGKKPEELLKIEHVDKITESTKNTVAAKAEKQLLKALFEYGSK